MKGIFVSNQFEYQIEVNGEQWSQGDQVHGKLILKNTSNERAKIDNLSIYLAYGDLKNIKKKDPKSFKVIKEIKINEQELNSGEVINSMVSFQLDINCQITEQSGSLFIVVCHDLQNPFDGVNLLLTVRPFKVISGFVQIFENFFRFKLKEFKNKKNTIESKVIVPSSKELSSVQSLNMQFSMKGNELNVVFLFKLKKVVFDGGIMGTKDVAAEISKTLNEKEYYFSKDSFNQEIICQKVKEVLDEIKVRPLV